MIRGDVSEGKRRQEADVAFGLAFAERFLKCKRYQKRFAGGRLTRSTP
jgi:hypothetical protein